MGDATREGIKSSGGRIKYQQANNIAAGIREPLIVLDTDLKAVAANKGFYSAFGLQEHQVINRSIYSLHDESWDVPKLRQLLEEIAERRQIKESLVQVDLKNFGRFRFLVNATFLELKEENLILLSLTKNEADPSAGSAEFKYLRTIRDVFMHAPALMCRLRGPNHIFELANKQYYQLIGQREIIGKPVRDVLPEVKSQGFLEILDEVYRSGEPYIGHENPVELMIQGEGRKSAFLNFVYQPTWDDHNKVNGIFVHAVDVTEQVEAKKKIEQSENYLRNLVDTVPVIIWISDISGNNTYLSRNWYEYTGQSREDAEGSGWIKCVHPEDKLRTQECFRQASKDRRAYEVSYRLQTKEGDYRWVIGRGSPKFNFDGEYEGMIGTVVDVHEEIVKGQLIKENEHRIRTIVQEATVATAVYTGPEMTVELANHAMIELWGKDDSVIGKPLREALPELEGQPFFGILEKVFATGETYWGKNDRVDLMVNGKMQTGYFNFNYKPLRNEDGEIYGILNMALDVTEQVITNKKIQESEKRYQDIIHSSPSLIATFDGKDMIISIANDAILEAWGKGKNIVGQPLLEAVPELRDQGFGEILHQVFETGEPYRAYEMPVNLYRNGRMDQAYFNFIFYPQRDLAGNIIGIVDIATEVTPQAELNKKTKESESYFRQMADLMPEKVINTDPKGNSIYFNQNWLDYTGLTSDELKAQEWTGWIHDEDKPEFQREWQQSLQSGNSFEREIRIRNKEGDYKWHLNRGEAVKDQSGEITMWISTNTEIQRLKEEEKRKGDFLKMVSHELKTPITSIKGYVQLLLSMIAKAGKKEVNALPLQPSLQRIDHQITRLTRLISEMLDLSRIEENRMELQKEVFSINDLVAQTVQDITYTNTHHQIEIDHQFECSIYADKDRIGQVLINLITNAIKYSPESRDIEIGIQQQKEGEVTVIVRDQGIGISLEDQENIFKRFYRITEEEEDTYSGFGIGLFLANEIVQRHKGVIKVSSKKGEGSEFSFSLPVVPPPNKPYTDGREY